MDKLRKIFTLKTLSWICMGIYLLCMIPLLVLGFYNYPCIDDFSSAANAHIIWKDTHSLLLTIGEVFAYTGHLYLNWTGDFATTFLTVLQPIIWGEKASFIVPVIMLGTITVGFYLLGKTILVSWLKVDKYISRIIIFLALFLVIERMCSGVEGFYWYTGAINYTVPYGFFLLLVSALFKMLTAKERKGQVGWLLVSYLFELFMGAGNYMLSVNVLIVNILVIGYVLYKKDKASIWKAIGAMVIFVTAFIASVAAPGNAARGGATEAKFGAVKSIFLSFYSCLEYVFEKWVDWTFVVVVLVAIPFMVLAARNITIRFRYPILVILFSYCFMSSLFTAPIYGAGNVDAGRIQNVLFMQCVFLSFFDVFYLVVWGVQNVIKRESQENMEQEGILSHHMFLYVVTSIVFLVFGGMITCVPTPDYYTTTSALYSLLSGEASGYGVEVNQRIEMLSDGDVKECKVKSFANRPYLLYFSDVTADSENWENVATSRYYEKDSIELEE